MAGQCVYHVKASIVIDALNLRPSHLLSLLPPPLPSQQLALFIILPNGEIPSWFGHHLDIVLRNCLMLDTYTRVLCVDRLSIDRVRDEKAEINWRY